MDIQTREAKARTLGYEGYSVLELRAPMANPELAQLIADLEVGTYSRRVFQAYSRGWDAAADEAAKATDEVGRLVASIRDRSGDYLAALDELESLARTGAEALELRLL